jgi:hypothetical protein
MDATAAAYLEGAGAPASRIRLWPAPLPGQFTAEFRAPSEPGVYTIRATGDGIHAEKSIHVSTAAAAMAPDDSDLLASVASSRSGRVFSDSEIAELRLHLGNAVNRQVVRDMIYPMRSPWWLLPFAVALSLEWFLRRKAGLR